MRKTVGDSRGPIYAFVRTHIQTGSFIQLSKARPQRSCQASFVGACLILHYGPRQHEVAPLERIRTSLTSRQVQEFWINPTKNRITYSSTRIWSCSFAATKLQHKSHRKCSQRVTNATSTYILYLVISSYVLGTLETSRTLFLVIGTVIEFWQRICSGSCKWRLDKSFAR